jgi:hypothetical protein
MKTLARGVLLAALGLGLAACAGNGSKHSPTGTASANIPASKRASSGAGRSTRSSAVAVRKSRPVGFNPIALDFTRSVQQIASINVTVNAPIRDGTMQLQVLRGNPYGPASGRKVVFHEQIPMTNIASPANEPTGVVALSTWSGTLSPSDWDGGCQNMLYTVAAVVVPSGSSFATPPSGSQTTEAAWFTCRSG